MAENSGQGNEQLFDWGSHIGATWQDVGIKKGRLMILSMLALIRRSISSALSHNITRWALVVLLVTSIGALAASFLMSSNVEAVWLARGSAFFLFWLAIILIAFHVDTVRIKHKKHRHNGSVLQ